MKNIETVETLSNVVPINVFDYIENRYPELLEDTPEILEALQWQPYRVPVPNIGLPQIKHWSYDDTGEHYEEIRFYNGILTIEL